MDIKNSKVEIETPLKGRPFGRLMAEKMPEESQRQVTGGATRCCTDNKIDDGSVQSML